jgi:plastocyanin
MTIHRLSHSIRVGTAVGLLVACGASDRQAPDPTTLVLSRTPLDNGHEQVGVAGARLPDSLRVLVTRDGVPVEGVNIIWFTTEGSLEPAAVRTGADGIAATTWTTLRLFAEQFAEARLDGVPLGILDGGHRVGFTAIATPDPNAPNTILVENDRFKPADITLEVGETVNWFWPPGSAGHNIVPDDGEAPPQSGALDDWPIWHVFRFTRAGVYRYHCAAHGAPGGVGMSGVIRVVEPVTD